MSASLNALVGSPAIRFLPRDAQAVSEGWLKAPSMWSTSQAALVLRIIQATKYLKSFPYRVVVLQLFSCSCCSFSRAFVDMLFDS